MSKVKDVRPEKVMVTLGDGKDYALIYDFNAYCCVEEKYGALDTALEALAGGGLTAFRILLWAGLQHDHEAQFPTPRSVNDLIRMADLVKYAEAINAAMAQALPEVAPAPEGEGKN